MMILHAEAIHENGVLRLLGPTPLEPRQKVRVTIDLAESPTAEAGHSESLDDWLQGLDSLAAEIQVPTLPADFCREDIYSDGRG